MVAPIFGSKPLEETPVIRSVAHKHLVIYSADELLTVCPACGKVLYARYDLAGAAAAMTREALAARPFTLWRYHEVLPVRVPSIAV